MPDQVHEFSDVRVFECASEGPLLKTGQDAVDLISSAGSHRVSLFAVPVARLGDDLVRLETQLAGDFLQNFTTYGFRVAIVGDISFHLNESRALRSFVVESDRGRHIWFVASLDELRVRLEGAA